MRTVEINKEEEVKNVNVTVDNTDTIRYGRCCLKIVVNKGLLTEFHEVSTIYTSSTPSNEQIESKVMAIIRQYLVRTCKPILMNIHYGTFEPVNCGYQYYLKEKLRRFYQTFEIICIQHCNEFNKVLTDKYQDLAKNMGIDLEDICTKKLKKIHSKTIF